jgi:hypothetical protein
VGERAEMSLEPGVAPTFCVQSSAQDGAGPRPATIAAPTPNAAGVANALRAPVSWTNRATGECGDAERGVGHPVLGREDATADLVRRARLDERQCCDVPEPPAGAGERHPGEADRKDRGGARQRQPGGAGAERGDEDARPVWQVRADISADPETRGRPRPLGPGDRRVGSVPESPPRHRCGKDVPGSAGYGASMSSDAASAAADPAQLESAAVSSFRASKSSPSTARSCGVICDSSCAR